MSLKTIQIADKPTLDGTRGIVSSNGAKLDIITNFLESGGGITDNPDYGLEAIKAGIMEAKQSVISGKAKVANALTAKGVSTAAGADFATMAANVNKITTLSQGTQDATAGAGQVLSGYTAYAKGGKVTGTIPSQGAQTITPGTSAKTIAAGRYLSGQQTIAGDPNLIPANIAKGKTIFGVAGTYGGSMATGTLRTEYVSGVYARDTCISPQTINLGFRPSILLVYLTAAKKTSIAAYFSESGKNGYEYGYTMGYRLISNDDLRSLSITDNGFEILSGNHLCYVIVNSETSLSDRQAAYIALP